MNGDRSAGSAMEEDEGRPRFFKVLVGDFARRLVRIPSSPSLLSFSFSCCGGCMRAPFAPLHQKGKKKGQAKNAIGLGSLLHFPHPPANSCSCSKILALRILSAKRAIR